MNLESDRALLEKYRRGDTATLALIYRHYSSTVIRALARGFAVGEAGSVARRHVGPLDLDAVHQETFVRAFSESARLHYDGLRPFGPYLLQIARSAAVDVLRSQGKLHRQAVPLNDEALAVVDLVDSPEQAALRAETLGVVRGFLLTLDGDALRFATARFIDGESQEAAGALVNWSRQQARTQEAKLKAACVRFLSDRGWLSESAVGARAIVGAVLGLFAATVGR